MEFPKRDQVTFNNLSDARVMMDLSVNGLNAISTTAARMIQLGAPMNCRSVVQLRSEGRTLAVLMLSILENFARLHPTQCEAPEECSFQDPAVMADYMERTEGDLIATIRTIDEQVLAVELAGGVIDDPEIEIDIVDLSNLN